MNFGNIVFLIIISFIIYLITIYNKFVSFKASIDASWSDIDVQLKRRYNLIPALLETVKSYSNYESETLEKVIKARQQAISANTQKEKEETTNILTGALGKLFALTEAYPDLKANSTFINLQMELSNIEGAIQNARRYYNASARDYNAKLDAFPDLIVARIFNFKPRKYFELAENKETIVRNMPEIKL